MLVETRFIHRRVWLCYEKKFESDIKLGPVIQRTDDPCPIKTVAQTLAAGGQRYPSRRPGCTRFLTTHCSILLDLGCLAWCEWEIDVAATERVVLMVRAACQSTSASISIHRTSFSTTPSSSGNLCLLLLLGDFVGAVRNILLGRWDGPATALGYRRAVERTVVGIGSRGR